MAANIKELCIREQNLFESSERVNNENYWSELSEFLLNNQHDFNHMGSASSAQGVIDGLGKALGGKKTHRVFDSTALRATQDLASSFQGTLTNPATVWSRLRYSDDELNDNEDAVIWLEEVNNRMHQFINESNFDTEVAKGYQSFVAMANMAMFVEQKENKETGEFDGLRFTSIHLSKIAWSEDKDGLVDTVYRKFDYTARQAFQRWGNRITDAMKKALEQDPEKSFEIVHAVYPRDPNQVKLNEVGRAAGDKRPIASVYYVGKEVLEESGYYEMPILVARWGTLAGERYGRGPGHLALPDVRSLNRLRQRGLEAIDLQVRPPILANQRDVFGELYFRPGGLSIVRDLNGVKEFTSQARADIFQFATEDLKSSINSIFFLDKLLLPPRTETGEMTAFEVSQRVEQMQRVLGPTLSRVNNELLQPLIIRVFKILLRSGVLPEAPSLVTEQGLDIEIVFVNQLARAQQQQDISSIQNWVQNLAGIAQFKPEVLDNIDADGIAKLSARILGVPEAAVTDSEVVEQTREARAQQAAQQQQIEQANMLADAQAKANNQ